MAAASVGSRLWRIWLAWRFHLWQQRRHRRLVLEQVMGRPLVVLPEVFNPTLFFSSELLAGTLPNLVKAADRVLDMGTGSGIQAVVAASLGARVVAVDVVPAAARCARINTLLNRVESQIDVREGDLFAPVAGERFDLVLFNPPYYRGQPDEPWEHAWRSTDVLDRFAAGLREALSPAGRAVLVVSLKAVHSAPHRKAMHSHASRSSATAEVEEVARRHNLSSRMLRERRLPGERFVILEWNPGGGPS